MRIGLTVSVVVLLCAGTIRAGELEAFAGRTAPMRAKRYTTADFIQKRHLKAMDMTLEIKGSMVYERNGRLRWQTDSPLKTVTVINSSMLTHFDAETGKTATLDTAKLKQMKELLGNLAAWMSGDIAEIRKFCSIRVAGKNTLELVPLAGKSFAQFAGCSISFLPDFSGIKSIKINEPSGDTLEITFFNQVLLDKTDDKVWSVK